MSLYRFFTDQGLERHLLGSHGLVTSSMQEAANKGKDAGRCPVCGRVCIVFTRSYLTKYNLYVWHTDFHNIMNDIFYYVFIVYSYRVC